MKMSNLKFYKRVLFNELICANDYTIRVNAIEKVSKDGMHVRKNVKLVPKFNSTSYISETIKWGFV